MIAERGRRRRRISSRARALLIAAFSVGLVLRLLGIDWGLPGHIYPEEPPFHPDEQVAFVGAANLYGEPTPTTFIWGGAFYIRVAWLARTGVRAALDPRLHREYAATLLLLRLLNAALALATGALVFGIGREMGGNTVGLGAAALLLVLPGPVLDAHYARPDVLVAFLVTACLACAVRAACGGDLRWLAAGGALTGAATATVLSGVVGLAPLVAAGIQACSQEAGRSRWRRLARAALHAAAGFVAGYALCNTEALFHWQAFRGGLEIARTFHNSGSYSFPVRPLTYVSFFAFGAPVFLMAYAGLVGLLLRPRPGGWTVASHLLFGYALLGFAGGDMMRHLEFIAAPSAATAALALVGIGAAVARSLRLDGARASEALLSAAALFTLQLSLGYVWPLAFEEDPRYRIGRSLVELAPPGASVGITRSFLNDRTYAPRPPVPGQLRSTLLVVRPDHDASGYLDLDLDFIATTDYARDRARGATAPRFFAELFAGTRYRLVAQAAPRGGPLFRFAFGAREPTDLSYVRSTFYLFGRTQALR